jgi:hypothetical protein
MTTAAGRNQPRLFRLLIGRLAGTACPASGGIGPWECFVKSKSLKTPIGRDGLIPNNQPILTVIGLSAFASHKNRGGFSAYAYQSLNGARLS